MKTVLSFALFAVCALQSFAQASAPKVPAAAEVNEARQSSFNKVWTTINEKHYDPTFGGVDWKSVRTVYEPQALAPGLSDKEFHDVLRRMLAELKLSHFGIHPPENFKTERPGHGGVAVTFDVTSLAECEARLLRLGAKAILPPHDEGFGRVALYADPDGNLFEIVELTHHFAADGS